MFEVKGIPILVDEIEILKQLRTDVELKTGRKILSKIKPSGDDIMVCCPIHNNGQEKRPSCGISIKHLGTRPPGTVHCFACGYVDNLEGFVSKCFGYDDSSYGLNWLIENYIGDIETNSRPLLSFDYSRDIKNNDISYITEEELKRYRFYHPYMWERKLTPEIVEKYDVGYQKDFIFEEGWQPMEVLTFPVRDINGNCLFVSRRAIYNKTFFLPKDLEKPVYGIYELPKNCSEVVICESVINALTSTIYGKPAVALFGTGNSLQYQQLNSLQVRKYILALDPDKSGREGEKRLEKYLKEKIITKLMIPEGKDINDLSYEEFLSLPEVFVG